MGGAASFLAFRYERIGRGTCETCSSAFTLLNPPCAPCARCDARLCRRCFTSSCTLRVPCAPGAVLALPFVPRAARTCDACGPEGEREERFVAQLLPFLAAGALVTRVQPSLLGEATAQVLLSLAPRERALRFATMQQTAQGQQPRDAGEVSLDDVAEIRSGAAAAAGAGLQRALLGASAAAAAVAAAAAASSSLSLSSSAAVAAPPYSPALVVHLVSARGRTVFVFACPDERALERWTLGLAEALALCKAKHSAVFAAPAARAAASAAAAAGASKAQAAQAEVARRQAERDAFKQRLGPVGMAGAAAILQARGGAATPGTNPAALASSAAAPAAHGEIPAALLETLGRPRAPAPIAPAGGVSAASLGALARRESGGGLAPMAVQTSAQAQAQAAQEAATAALSRAASAVRVGLGTLRTAFEASLPPR